MTVQNISVASDAAESEFQAEQVFTIASGHFVHDIYSAFLAPLLPLIIERLSLSLTLAGSLSAFMQFPSILTPFIGHLADKYNLRYLVILAPALTATFMSAMGLASIWSDTAMDMSCGLESVLYSVTPFTSVIHMYSASFIMCSLASLPGFLRPPSMAKQQKVQCWLHRECLIGYQVNNAGNLYR